MTTVNRPGVNAARQRLHKAKQDAYKAYRPWMLGKEGGTPDFHDRTPEEHAEADRLRVEMVAAKAAYDAAMQEQP